MILGGTRCPTGDALLEGFHEIGISIVKTVKDGW
jgi:hypothetical protein